MHEHWTHPAGSITVDGQKVGVILAKTQLHGVWTGTWEAYLQRDGQAPAVLDEGPFKSFREAYAAVSKRDSMGWLIDEGRDPFLLQGFVERLHAKRGARVMEMGTKRSNPEVSTMHRDWAAEDADYVCTDIEMGIDVDVAVDAHVMSTAFAPDSFDAIISVSVYEHLQRPWIAAMELAKVLKPGGEALIYTHFAFPVHGYPCDYFRFTKDGLQTIFLDAGLEIVASDYENRAWIDSAADPHTKGGLAYTGVRVVVRKPQSPNHAHEGVPEP